jgi:hypothetical protein
MALIKVKTGSSSWTTYSKAFVKTTSSAWSAVKKIYMNSGIAWNLIWPVAGPYTTTSPIIRLHSYSSAGYKNVGDVIQMGPGAAATPPTTIQDGESGSYTSAKLWGQDGVWVANTNAVITRNFYYNSINDFTSANSASGVTDTILNDNSTYGVLRFDNKYLWYYVEETNNTGTGSDYSNPLFIIKKRPITPSAFSITTPAIATVGIPITLTYTIEDSSVWYRNPDLSLSYIEWFSESSITSNPTNYISGSKKYLNEVTSFTPTISENNKYIHAKITLINSYSTYYSDTSISSVTNTTAQVQQSSPPTVNSYPVLNGSPTAFSYLTTTSGSYSNYASKATDIVVSVSTQYPTQGANSDTSTMTKGASTYTVTQADATNVSYNFFARDIVSGIDGKTYYYYSPFKKSTMGVVSDDFSDRTLTSGLGTMSSGFTYSGPAITPYPSGASWRVSSGYGVSNTAVTLSDSASYWPLRSIEMGGKTDVYVSVDFPGATGGLGVAFWAASTANWWSARCYHETSIGTSEACTGTGGSNTTGAPTSPATGSGSACNISSSSEYTCGSTQYSSATSVSNSTSAGGACNVTTSTSYACLSTVYAGSTSYPSNVGSNGGAQCNVTTRIDWPCNSGYYESSTAFSTGSQPGDYCGTGSYITYPCGSSITEYTSPQGTGSGAGQKCYYNSYVTFPCGAGVYSTSTAISNGSDSANAYCSVYSSSTTSYACTGSSTGYSTTQSMGNNAGEKCNETASTSTGYSWTYVSFGSSPSSSSTTCNKAADVGKYQTGTRTSSIPPATGFYSYNLCTSTSTTTYYYQTRSTTGTTTTTYYYSLRAASGTTYYQYQTRSATGTTTYYASRRSSSGGTVYYDYSLRTTSPTTTWYYNTRASSPTTTYTWSTIQTSNTTKYDTYIKIAAAEGGSTVNEKGSSKIDSSATGYLTVWGVTASLSGNSITAWLKGSGGSTLGTPLTINASSPVKADGSGNSSAGIIKGYSSTNIGTSFDNLLII